MNYFPWFKTLKKEIPDLIHKELKEKFAGFTFTSEIIFGIIISIYLKVLVYEKKAFISRNIGKVSMYSFLKKY